MMRPSWSGRRLNHALFEVLLPGTSPTESPVYPSDDDIRLLIKSRIVSTFISIFSISRKVIFANVLISSNALRISIFQKLLKKFAHKILNDVVGQASQSKIIHYYPPIFKKYQ